MSETKQWSRGPVVCGSNTLHSPAGTDWFLRSLADLDGAHFVDGLARSINTFAEAELQDERAAHEATRRELADVRHAWKRDLAKGREFVAEADQLHAELDTTKRELEEAKAEVDRQCDSRSDAEEETKRLRAEVERLKQAGSELVRVNDQRFRELTEAREEVERLKGELARREDQLVGESLSMKDDELCLKKCDHGSECLHRAGHGDRHETQHGCIFYGDKPQPQPAKGVEEWRAEKGLDDTWVIVDVTTGGYWTLVFGEVAAHSLARAINDSIARGRAERGDDGRLEQVRGVIARWKEKGESYESMERVEKIVSPPARYVVKVSGTTQAYDTKAGAEAEANALRSNWGIDAKVEES